MNGLKVRIRNMEENDIPRLMEIEAISFPSPWTEDMFKYQMKLKDVALNLVLVEDDVVIGYAIAWFVYDEMHLLSIALIPDRRGKGYAGEILDAVIAGGAEREICKIVLEVRESNTSAKRFYKKRMFKVIGKRKGYYRETGEDALIMELSLK